MSKITLATLFDRNKSDLRKQFDGQKIDLVLFPKFHLGTLSRGRDQSWDDKSAGRKMILLLSNEVIRAIFGALYFFQRSLSSPANTIQYKMMMKITPTSIILYVKIHLPDWLCFGIICGQDHYMVLVFL